MQSWHMKLLGVGDFATKIVDLTKILAGGWQVYTSWVADHTSDV